MVFFFCRNYVPEFRRLTSLNLFRAKYTDNFLTIASNKWRHVNTFSAYHIGRQFVGSTLPEVIGNWSGLTTLSLHGIHVASQYFAFVHDIGQLNSLSIISKLENFIFNLKS